MAEGLFDGTDGDDEPGEDTEASSPSISDAFAAAIAARLSANDPGVSRKTEEFLAEQTRLVAVQREILEEEHALRHSKLQGQRIGIYIRVAFQVFIAIAAGIVGIGLVILMRDAVTSRSVIVEAFESPPGLASSGVSGTVVASGLLDELTRLQNATQTSAASKRDLSSAWAHEVKVSVPDAGLSLGEISHLLKARFGNDIHIGGDLVATPAGTLALTVRGDGVQARTFMGPAAGLDGLIVTAAQYVYAESQPVLWAIYLEGAGRDADELEFIKSIYAGAKAEDRPYLLNSWANVNSNLGGPILESLRLYRAAIKLKPDYWVARSNVINLLGGMGDEEGAWRAGNELAASAGGRRGAVNESYFAPWDALTWNLLALRDAQAADADASGGIGTTDFSVGAYIAQVDVLLHDINAAELMFQTVKTDDRDPSIAAGLHFARGLLALEIHDPARAVAEMETFGSALSNPKIATGYPLARCWIARAEEYAGHPDKADQYLKNDGTFVECHRFRGDILAGRGDWDGARKAYADAVALAPDLPAGYYSWGVALAGRGDLAGAASRLKDAHVRGPHWADPLKAWGDVLARQGKAKEALQKYAEAIRFAPEWKELKAARAALAARKT
jgi:tetratricopeptide (TPR) repeat protein